MTTVSPQKTSLWRPLLFIAVLVLAGAILIPQVTQLQDGFHRLGEAHIGFLALGSLSVAGAVIASGGTYTYLALRPVRLRRAVLVQFAGMFVNRLLPAGVGGMGLNARFLYVYRHTVAEAATVAGINNLVTGCGHLILLIGAVVVAGVAFPDVQMPGASYGAVLAIFAFFVCVIFVLGKQFAWAVKIKAFLHDIASALGQYKLFSGKFGMALLCAMANTFCHTIALYCCMLAFDIHMSVAVALLVLTGGVAAASMTPTPGGVVGAEAGLAAGLMGFDVAAPTAIAAAVSYRVVSYWLPLLPGALTFWYIQKQKII